MKSLGGIDVGLPIKTKRLLLRPIAERDVPIMEKWLQVGSLYKYWSSSRERGQQILDICFYKEDGLTKSYHWGIQFQDKVIGELWTFIEKNSNSAKIAYWISSEYWGIGIATESVYAIVELSFKTIGVCRVSADVFVENKASIRVLEKIGFQQIRVIRNNEAESNYNKDYYIYEITK